MRYAPAAFDHVDYLAEAALPRVALERYCAYRDAMMADGQDAACIVTTLSLFLRDLVEGRPEASIH